MKNIFLSLVVLPLFIQSMQKPPVPAASKPAAAKIAYTQEKIYFIDKKLTQMMEELKEAKKRIRLSLAADISTAKMQYDLKAEECSANIFTIMKINSVAILIQIKKNQELRNKMLFVLHNSDPAKDAPWAKDHEELLKTFYLDDAKSKNTIEWAVAFDKDLLTKQRKAQRYGTYLDQNFDVQTPVAACSRVLEESDVHKINARRAAIGLPSIEEQLVDAYQKEQMNKRRDC